MVSLEKLTVKLFPKKWSRITLLSEDVESFLCINHEIPVKKTKSLLGQGDWSYKKLKNLISNRGKLINEGWSFPAEGKNLLIWEKEGYSLRECHSKCVNSR